MTNDVEKQYMPCNLAYREGVTQAHALAKVLYRINIGKNYYGFVINLPYDVSFMREFVKKQGLKNFGFDDDTISKLLSKQKRKALSKDCYQVLFNACYHDLDKWAYSQWEGYPEFNSMGLKKSYKGDSFDKSRIYKKMRKTNLKEFYYLRYNQCIIVLGKNREDMEKLSFAFKNKLKRYEGLRIGLPKVVDLRKDKLTFQDFNLRVKLLRGKYVVESQVSLERCKIIKEFLKKEMLKVIRSNDVNSQVKIYNNHIMNMKRDYRYATKINDNFSKLARELDIWAYHKLSRDNRIGYKKVKGDTTLRSYRECILKTLYGTTFYAPHMIKL